MIIPAFLADLRAFIHALNEAFWAGIALFLDLAMGAGPLQAAMILAALVGIAFASGKAMQSHLNKRLTRAPGEEINLLKVEFRYSLPGYIFRMIRFLIMLPLLIVRAILSIFKKDDDEEEAKEPNDDPLLVPSLGPSYLWASLVCAFLAALVLMSAPLLQWHLDASAHFPSWQYLLLGHRPEMGMHLPLDQSPYGAAVVVGTLWIVLWSTTARITRLIQWNHMGRNLVDDVANYEVLTSWRDYFAMENLAERNASYDTWAIWLPIAAAPLLLFAFTTLGGEPYRISHIGFSVALVVWVGWVMHLVLEGVYRPAKTEEETEEEEESVVAAGWGDVLGDLQRVQGVAEPALLEPARPIEPLAFSDHSLSSSRLISPLLAELLPDPQRLTAMQHDVLSHLSRHSFVHVDPPGDTRSLELDGNRADEGQDLRHRNQIVIAPEGSGKTTLATMACFNAALTHASSSLFVVRTPEQAKKLAANLRDQVNPSTLRWNLRVRRVGGDLVEDLADGIVPDLLVCDLQSLVTTVLDDVETHEPFLKHLSLIVVDDVETYCGPVEAHAQLAFRRLQLRINQLQQADQIGEEQEPLFLLLASETMDELAAWARSLCGIDAVPRRFASQGATRRRELARKARQAVDDSTQKDSEKDSEEEGKKQVADEAIEEPAPPKHAAKEDVKTADGRRRVQRLYALGDFVGPTGDPLAITDIIDACESLAVPWHYRPCGDHRRLLGRSVLPLRDEPQSYTDDPLQAAVIFLDGHATDIRREVARLGRAGARFTSRNDGQDEEHIAIITRTDADEQRLLDTVDETPGLAKLVDELPRPFLRPPSGHLKRRHLTSELVQHWTETADLLDVFGHDIALLLQDLAQKEAVLCEARTVLDDELRDYSSHVFLRGLESRLRPDPNQPLADEEGALLPPRVDQVEVSSQRHVAVREQSTMVELFRVDAESARRRFYPGRIFETARGRHVVVDYGDGDPSDVIAEPFLGDHITSARRQISVELIAREAGSLTPEPVYLGACPMGVGLFPVKCQIKHRATFRIDPGSAQIRQRIYASESERRQVSVLPTEALALYPQLDDPDDNGDDAPALHTGGARVIAAALRAVIPLLYRGADDALALALQLDGDADDLTRPLKATEGFFFYDLHHEGNGAARAIERDGVGALLRLANHLLDVLGDADRLLALHDECPDMMDTDARDDALTNADQWLSSRLGGTP